MEFTVIEVPDVVYEVLARKAKYLGRTVVDVIVDSVISNLDPESRVEVYLKLHDKYLSDAEDLYRRGDLTQASEKYWGAVYAILSAIAESGGLPHFRHGHFEELIELLSEELNDRELPKLFASAERLHANFYHGFLRKFGFEIHREDVLKLVEKLRNYLTELRSTRC
ncbi:MAG: PaREP1/PaREP8 domain-contain protein [Thermoprotei archaeon]|nr:MAG: PaREP1/PaREP8 domain-contain protein [Thermoprotei archaeon]